MTVAAQGTADAKSGELSNRCDEEANPSLEFRSKRATQNAAKLLANLQHLSNGAARRGASLLLVVGGRRDADSDQNLRRTGLSQEPSDGVSARCNLRHVRQCARRKATESAL